MKRFLLFLSIMMLLNVMLLVQTANGQQYFTLVSFNFNVNNDSSQTFGNTYNTDDVVQRDSTYHSSFTYNQGIDGIGDYCLTSSEWAGGFDSVKNYSISFSTIFYTDIRISSRQKSSGTGPKHFKLQYKVGVSGVWTNLAGGKIHTLTDTFPTGTTNYYLPLECNNQSKVRIRWIMSSDSSVNNGIVDASGTSSIDNIIIQGHLQDSCAFLNINQVKAKIITGGLNFFKPYDTPTQDCFEYPADSGKHTIFCSALWLGVKQNGVLRLAGERYHGNGRDYYPGPAMDASLYPSEVTNWNKVWKINKSDIDYHIANWNIPGYVIPTSISQWPVESNPAIGANYWMAPFVDVDGDNSYNPANGDYPDIRGDQAIYFIFNDSVYPHTETGGNRLGVEVHAMAYAYNTDPLLEKTIFMNYLIYNRSSRIYDSLYMGMFTDIDIGNPTDDYIGCDTLLQTYFCYNGDSIDEGTIGYGTNPPVQTVTMLNQTMTSFAYFNNTGGGVQAITDPDLAIEYYLIMTNHWKDGEHFCYGGMGHPLAGGDTTRPVKFMFPGYPNDSTQWNEASIGNPPYDRRGVGITGPFTLAPMQYISYDVAYIVADSGFGKSGGFSNIDNMLQIVPQIRDYFNSHHPQDGHDLALGIDEQQKNNPASTPQFTIYPNPTTDKLTFTTNLTNAILTLDILDINGRLLQTSLCNGSRKVLDVSNLKKGIYILKIHSSQQTNFVKFVKM